ncbi:HTH-type transcriptional regulator BhcR [Defluviimonas sp. SAOS-178_SWC]|uniref:HTH-type transcriptional regulator BhcR n=1 Tax=Defluviimonas sp. SAOS-178_SWC TaxID=3121287 RepID=UPI0032218415
MDEKPARRGRPRAWSGSASQPTIRALDRALDVLDAIAAANGLTLSEISRQLGESPATIYRILTTFEARGMAESEAHSQVWRVGAAAFRLGTAFLRRSNVLERSQAQMRLLMETTGETSNLGIERNGAVMFIAQAETHESIRAFFPPGTVSPMHASGIGKALLSRYEDSRVKDFLHDRQLERFTDKTITSREALLDDLKQIRAVGYSYDDEERTTGMRCVAAPIIDAYGKAVAGISVSGPTHRMRSDMIPRLGLLVAAAAARVSRDIGAAIRP